jgi:hypothetical protein
VRLTGRYRDGTDSVDIRGRPRGYLLVNTRLYRPDSGLDQRLTYSASIPRGAVERAPFGPTVVYEAAISPNRYRPVAA